MSFAPQDSAPCVGVLFLSVFLGRGPFPFLSHHTAPALFGLVQLVVADCNFSSFPVLTTAAPTPDARFVGPLQMVSVVSELEESCSR